jgi:hypothetical protein
MGKAGMYIVFCKPSIFDAHNALAATFLLAAQCLDVDPQQPGCLDDRNPFWHFAPPAGRLKDHHCFIFGHTVNSLFLFEPLATP